MTGKFVFMFISKAITEGERRSVMPIEGGGDEIITVGVNSYSKAAEVAKKLVDEGALQIELCAGFGHMGVAKVVEALKGRVPVGVVRFDSHPEYDGETGDELWL